MKKLVWLLSFCSLTTMTAFAQSEAKSDTKTEAKPACNQGKGDHAARKAMMREIGITPEEGQKLKAFAQDTRKEVKAVRDNTTLNADQRKAKIKALHESTQVRIAQVIGQEKANKLKEMREKRHRDGAHKHGGEHDGEGKDRPADKEGK